MRLLVFPEIGGKANGTLLGRRRVCELTDRQENGGDRSVMSGKLLLDVRLELIEPPGSSLFEARSSRSFRKRARHKRSSRGPGAVEDGGGHDGSMVKPLKTDPIGWCGS